MRRSLFQPVRRARAWLRNRATRPAVVLCYHRVTVLARDPHLLTIAPGQFEEHLQVIREFGTPMTFRDLARAVQTGRPIRNAIVVTFDDGYADNLHEAAPLLERHDVPATVFVTTGQIGARTEFWWDALDQVMLGSHALPAVLVLGSSDVPLDVPALARMPASAVTNADDMQTRRRQREELMHTIRNRLLECRPADIPTIMRDLHDATQVSSEPRPTHRCCSADELRALAGGGLIEIGAHTVTHPRLALLDTEAQTRELATSRETLEALLDVPVTSVAYPFGRSTDINAETVVAAHRAGFEAGCTLGEAPIPTGRMFTSNIDPLLLPRYAVHPIDGDGLSERLRAWLRT